jgi:hypothetical protein
MTAGDSGFQAEAMLHVHGAIGRQLSAKPDVWPNVSDAAAHYIYFYAQKKRQALQRAFLISVGLDYKTFLESKKLSRHPIL